MVAAAGPAIQLAQSITRRPEKIPSLIVPTLSNARFADAVEGGAIVAQDQVLLPRREERAVFAHVVERLPVSAEALDVGHVGAPHQPVRAQLIAHAFGQRLPLGVGIVPDAAV